MRIYRVETDDGLPYVVENDDRVFHLVGDLFESWEIGPELLRGLEDLKIVAPVVPSKIVAVGLNYRAHAAEQGQPLPAEALIFIKPSTSVIGPGDAIVIPPGIGRVDHEAEVGVVIGRRASRVSERDAHQYVFALICFNDVSARGLQQKGYQYTHAKGFDTFAPLGPCIAAGVDHRASAGIGIEGWVNGQRRQNSTTAQLVFSIDYLIAYITNVMTLLPGDVVATGTPSGVGPL